MWNMRDETGKFVSNTNAGNKNEKPIEAGKEDKKNINYDAEIKNYEAKIQELKQQRDKEIEEQKQAVSAARKADAVKVEDAFKKLNAAKAAYNEKAAEAKKEYFEAVSEAKKKYNSVISEISKSLDEAEAAYDAAFKEFTKIHKDGFHLTLRDGDNIKEISRSGNVDLLNSFDTVFDSLFNVFNKFNW